MVMTGKNFSGGGLVKEVAKSVARRITRGLDSSDASVFGGQLQKAQLLFFKTDDLAKKHLDNLDEGGQPAAGFEFFINPHTITVEKSVQLKRDEANEGPESVSYSKTHPITLSIGEMWFDTYEERVSVRTIYINRLERLLDYVEDTHVPPVVVFNWGQFSSTVENPSEWKFFVTKLKVDYTMFLPDGTPVRAKVGLTLEQVPDSAEKKPDKESPDHAKLYTVKSGDTLQGIAMAEYENPGEWRRIANTNNLDDPMDLRPGMKLLVPPILK